MSENRIPQLEKPTVKAAIGSLADFPIVKGSAVMAQDSGIRELFGYSDIGRVEGEAVFLAQGSQMLTKFDARPVKMILFGSGGRDQNGPRHHMYYEHGKVKEGATLVALDHKCPGTQLEIDCGCRNHTDQAFQKVYGDHNPASAAYLALGTYTSAEERIGLANDILNMRGVIDRDHVIGTPGFWNDCSTVEALKQNNEVLSVHYGGEGRVYLKTHDIPVTYRGGNPARLIVIEEPYGEDKKGYAGKARKHYALVVGDVSDTKKPPIFRPHSICDTSEYGGNGCDCRVQKERTLARIQENGSGVLMILDQNGMATGSMNKYWQTAFTANTDTDLLQARTKHLGLRGDMREYEILEFLARETGMSEVNATTNNLEKINMMAHYGLIAVAHSALPITEADYSMFARQAMKDFKAKADRKGRYTPYTHSGGNGNGNH